MYEIRLFGKCSFLHNGDAIACLPEGKAQNLLCYLLVNRCRTHSREALASLYWGHHPTALSKKYLRTALWQIRTALQEPAENGLLLIESDSVCINPKAGFALDIAEFEQAYTSTPPGREIELGHTELLHRAVELYRGELLEGCYEDWCLCERERLQNIYLMVLDKLLSICEQRVDCEKGQAYASMILRYDPASERTHQRLMRLYCTAGHRAGALRQYERCVTALKQELGVKPSRQTLELYESICADDFQEQVKAQVPSSASGPSPSPDDLFSRLRSIRTALSSLRSKLEDDISTLDKLLTPKSAPTKPVQRISPSHLRVRRPVE